MEIIRSGPQYRQNPPIWGTDLSPGGAKNQGLPVTRELDPLGGTPNREGSPQNRFFDSLVGRLRQGNYYDVQC